MENGRVVLSAEAAADVRVGVVRELAGKITSELAGERHGLSASLRAEVLGLHVVDLRNAAEDVVEGHEVLLGTPDVREYLLGEIEGEWAARQIAEGADPDERALELADVRLDAIRDEVGDVIGQGHPIELRLLLEDRDACLEVRRLDVRAHRRQEARPEALLEIRDLLRRAVAGQDDLAAREEVVVRVEELVLGTLLAGQELDVVDQEEVAGPIPLTELWRLVVPDGGDEVVRELLARQILDAQMR